MRKSSRGRLYVSSMRLAQESQHLGAGENGGGGFAFPTFSLRFETGASLEAKGASRDPRLLCRAVLARYRASNPALDREAGALLKQRQREVAAIGCSAFAARVTWDGVRSHSGGSPC